MLTTLSDVRELSGAAISTGYAYALGANRGLTFTFTGTAGGGFWRASESLRPDPMKVHSMAVQVLDANSYVQAGGRCGLGRLTGNPNFPLEFLAQGECKILDNWVRAPGPFSTDFGVFMWIPHYYANATWFLKGVCSYG